MHPLRRARHEARRLGPRLWRRLSSVADAEARQNSVAVADQGASGSAAAAESSGSSRVRTVALAGAALAVTSTAAAYCLGLGPASIARANETPPDPTGYDATRLAAAGWRGKVGIRQYMANSPIEDRGLCSATAQGELLIGVLDGHGGWQVAEYVQQKLLGELEVQRGGKQTEATLSDALTAAFEAMDESIAALLLPGFGAGFGNVARVGACTTLCVVSDARVVVANAGDCRVVLGRRVGGPHPRTLGPSATPDAGPDLGPLPASKHSQLCSPGAGLDMTPLEERRMPWMAHLRPCTDAAPGPRPGANGSPGVAAWELTNDHNARVPFEQLKLLREHPHEADIIRCKRADACYVKGRLQPTRSLGDLYLKHPDYNGPPYPWIWGPKYDRSRGRHVSGGSGWSSDAEEVAPKPSLPYITATPEVARIRRDATDVVLIAGTDGLWDYLSSQEAVDIASAVLEDGGGVGRAAEELREEVLRRTSAKYDLRLDEVKALAPGRDRRNRHDDITVVVVDLRSSD